MWGQLSAPVDTAIGQACGIEGELTAESKKALRPGLDAIIRLARKATCRRGHTVHKPRAKSTDIAPRKSDTVKGVPSADRQDRVRHAKAHVLYAPTARRPERS